jgi:hypothetical protein
MMEPYHGQISERQVLQDARSGYYIGRQQYKNGQWWPYSRESVETWDYLGFASLALALGEWTFTSQYGGVWDLA